MQQLLFFPFCFIMFTASFPLTPSLSLSSRLSFNLTSSCIPRIPDSFKYVQAHHWNLNGHTNSELPPSPYSYRVPCSAVTVTFYNYGHYLSDTIVSHHNQKRQSCVPYCKIDRVSQPSFRESINYANFNTLKATQSVIGAGYDDAVAHRPDEKVGTQEIHYSRVYMDVVDLAVTPSEEMTWEMWRYALLGIRSFMQDWEYVELSFDVVVLGTGRVGIGRVFQ